MKFDIQKTNMVKCIATLLLLIHHLFGCSDPVVVEYGVYSLWIPFADVETFAKAAKVCVATFVFLSAYGIAISFNNKNITDKQSFEKFCFNRHTKLFLNFFFVYLLSFLFAIVMKRSIIEVYDPNQTGAGFLCALFDMNGLAYFFGTPSLNNTWWYMSLAILLVYTIPLLVLLYKKIGRILLIIFALDWVFRFFNGYVFSLYLFSAICGIVFAEENYFEKIHNFTIIKNTKIASLMRLILFTGLFFGLMNLRKDYSNLIYWLDAGAPILLGVIVMDLHNILPFLSKPMSFIGKHSMNIFLIHSFINYYYFTHYIYSFKHWGLILLALLISSLIVSIIVEWLKRITRYNLLIQKLTN